MAREKGYRGLTPAEQRAARDQRLSAQVDHVEQAKQREMKMVANLGQFTDECRWFMANKVWLTLGYETLVSWWADRIAPVVDSLGLRPGPELTQLAIEAIQKEEEALPPAQRHTKKAISAIVGVSEWKVRARQDPRQRRTAAGADLDNTKPEVIDGEWRDEAPGNPLDASAAPASTDQSALVAERSRSEPLVAPGGAGISLPPAAAEGKSVPKPPVWQDDDPEVVEAHRRRRVSKSFAEGVAFVWAALDPDPIAWLGRSWDPAANPFAGMTSMAKVFSPEGLRRTADHLLALAAHLDEKGETL